MLDLPCSFQSGIGQFLKRAEIEAYKVRGYFNFLLAIGQFLKVTEI